MSYSPTLLDSPIFQSVASFPPSPSSPSSPHRMYKRNPSPPSPSPTLHARDFPNREVRRQTVQVRTGNYSRPLFSPDYRMEEFSIGPLEQDVIFGQSSYQTRRLPRSPAFIFSTPTFSSPNSEDDSPSSSGSTTPLPLTPGTPLHPEFDFQSKHSSQEEKAQQPALVGLGMRGVFTHEEQKSMDPSLVRAPVPEPQTVSSSGSTSRLFKVGRGGRAVFFDPVAPAPRTIVPKIISAPRVFTRSSSGHSISHSHSHSIEGDDSEEEFISHDRSPTSSPRLACEMTGPVTLKELIVLRQQVQRVYEQALRGRGNGMTIKQEREKRIRRKAVPSMLVEHKRKVKEDIFSVKENNAPLIPGRTDSLPTSKPYFLNAPPLPLSAQSDNFSFPSQGISRARKPSSLTCHSRTRSSTSSTNETVASSTHGSVRSGVSTLASPVSESGSMPITPVASHSTAPIAIRAGNHPFFAKNNKAFELDVASMLAPDSPEFNHSAMDMEDDDDDEEEELSTETPSQSQKNFYQNQGATKSTWALFTAKLKQAGGQNKEKTEKIEKTGRKLWGRQKAER